LAFRNAQEADMYLQPMAEHVALPFCNAANSANQKAELLMLVSNRFARIFECGQARWSDWVDLGEGMAGRTRTEAAPQPDPSPSEVQDDEGLVSGETLAKVTSGCQAIHRSAKIPVDCSIQAVGGMPSVLLGFRNQQEAEEYIGPTARYVGAPFCNAANQAGMVASVFVFVGQTRGRQFRCDRATWGEWTELARPTRRPGRRPRPSPNVVRF
jgi:hypothetical protein